MINLNLCFIAVYQLVLAMEHSVLKMPFVFLMIVKRLIIVIVLKDSLEMVYQLVNQFHHHVTFVITVVFMLHALQIIGKNHLKNTRRFIKSSYY